MQREKKNSYGQGVAAEDIACDFLKSLGFSIICRRFVVGRGSDAGEIDIIAKAKNQLVFVEVKKRVDFDTASFSISQKQMSRIYHSAEVFLAQNSQYNNFDCRFDAIILNDGMEVRHIPNAWGF